MGTSGIYIKSDRERQNEMATGIRDSEGRVQCRSLKL